ncbi:sigma-70 family RNA polymerase sigma factor [Paraliomyxa miuraensis]|uniref:sigma-70 family RNA polymerase sigma factor n=1 Tax=Paraliomyxa miuraensis TaxID=376150 RepID=UPI0022582CBC|nr:sigma-70 family RNA polymerase sigma factor [Paraliomyxa miuraensis]MCX4240807.1 sigma-70 family RNA polymerase sigma factor [Paraliomyxa miuraensis]
MTEASPKESAVEEDLSALGIYFRQMGAVDLMTPDEERAAANRIVSHREAYWRAIFDYPPFVDGLVNVVEQVIDQDRWPHAALEELRKTSRRVRDRETRAHKEAFTHAINEASAGMAMADPDGEATAVIIHDLEAIRDGQREGLRVEVTLPRQDSAPFRRYVEKVQLAHMALWREKNDFVRANLRLVVTMARRFNRGRMSLPDLIQEGNIGLMKAVDRFDPRRGFRFSTYGSWWIRHAISRALADKGREVRVPVHMLELHHKLTRVRREFEAKEGRPPEDEELARAADVSLEKIERMRQCLLDQGPSLDTPLSEDDGRTGADLLEDDSVPPPNERLQQAALNDRVLEFMGRLPPIEADVLRKRFGLDQDAPMTLREIGEQYSLSRERIRQLQEQALTKIRRELRRNDML